MQQNENRQAQRIFRNDKHGMDFVILETLKELKSGKTVMNITYLLPRERTGAWKNRRISISLSFAALLIHCGSR